MFYFLHFAAVDNLIFFPSLLSQDKVVWSPSELLWISTFSLYWTDTRWLDHELFWGLVSSELVLQDDCRRQLCRDLLICFVVTSLLDSSSMSGWSCQQKERALHFGGLDKNWATPITWKSAQLRWQPGLNWFAWWLSKHTPITSFVFRSCGGLLW